MDVNSLLNRACEAKYEGTFFNGKIVAFHKDARGNPMILVDFFGYNRKSRCNPEDVSEPYKFIHNVGKCVSSSSY